MNRGELEDGDPVVLPTGKRAVVLRRLNDDENRLELRYLDGGPNDTIILPARLVRLVRPGVYTPPVRVPGLKVRR